MGGAIGILALGVIFLIGLMFLPEIYGQIGASSNVTGTIYAQPYHAVENLTITTGGHGLPAIIILIFIIGIIVGVAVFLTILKRR